RTAVLEVEREVGMAECGFWTKDEHDAYYRARQILVEQFTKNNVPLPEWLKDEEPTTPANEDEGGIHDGIVTGLTPCGPPFADDRDTYKVVAYADGENYGCQRKGNGQWWLFKKGERMPRGIEKALCEALGLDVKS